MDPTYTSHPHDCICSRCETIAKEDAEARRSAAACSGLECLSVWLVETIRWDAHHEKGNHSEAYIVAKDIKAVWKWLAIDLSDEGVEIRSITNKAPVLAVIPNIQNAMAMPSGDGVAIESKLKN